MPKKLTNTARRALGAGDKAVSMSAKSPGDMTKLKNTTKRSTSKTGKKSPDFGKLGRTTLKDNKAKTGKGGGGY
jgi:hypothetical protein